MVSKNLLLCFFLAFFIRFFLYRIDTELNIQNRVEVTTPLNSWKRVKEGAFLYKNEINPYSGDVYHENPLFLILTNFLINNLEPAIPFVFIILDMLTSLLLYGAVSKFILEMYKDQEKEKSTYAKDTEELHISKNDLKTIPYYVCVSYLMNPYSIFSCVGLTTTTWSNFFLAAFFYCLSRKQKVYTILALTFESQKNFYPFVLIIPAALYLSQTKKSRKFYIFETILMYVISMIFVNYMGFIIMRDWSFLDATYGFILNHRDFQPNIGLFWYFFMEMFDHFRTLFLYTFQMNATILYLLPLTLKLKDSPIMLATVLTALSTIFRSYPCVGDVAFYLSLMPLWKNSAKFLTHNFIVGCFFLVTSVLGPTVYYLWIYEKSANANFYFGVTLAFSTAQIFLVTDLLFAFIKREFCLKNGIEIKIDGKDARMALE